MIRRFLMGAVLLLSACASGTEESPLQLEVFNSTRDVIRARLAQGEPVERPPLRRADLDPLEGSFLEASIERRDILAYLFVNAELTDDHPGRLRVWRTDDNVTLTMRNDILISTRGLGDDLLSSRVQAQGARPGPASGGEHVQFIRTALYDSRQMTFACELEDLGPETIVIVQRRHATRHLRQTCEGATGNFANDYWVDNAAGLVWQSRQWAGPGIGYMRFRRLTNQ
ncbi:YjbF family lipoprotein [Lutimaribacter marinistellae]|uniref:YjbF family lipoprotein n=1 Tax=Lutimaribacter marinistellae TaxID=1820329 RepID=A0ABV7TCT3_9RHOB